MRVRFAAALCRWVPNERWKGDYDLDVGNSGLFEFASDAQKRIVEVCSSSTIDKCLIIVDLMSNSGPCLAQFVGAVPVKYFGYSIELGSKIEKARDQIVASALAQMSQLIR